MADCGGVPIGVRRIFIRELRQHHSRKVDACLMNTEQQALRILTTCIEHLLVLSIAHH